MRLSEKQQRNLVELHMNPNLKVAKISAVLQQNSQCGSYNTVSRAEMNKLVKIRIDPKPELSIPIWYLYLSLCICLQEHAFLPSLGTN